MHLLIKLINNIKYQSKYISNAFNIELSDGQELLANAVYCSKSYEDLINEVKNYPKLENYRVAFAIAEPGCDDNLRHEIEYDIDEMAHRVMKLITIHISKTKVISILYSAFKFFDSAKNIINNSIDLMWQPLYSFLPDPNLVLYCDIDINNTFHRVIATRVSYQSFNRIAVYSYCKKVIERNYLDESTNEYAVLKEHFDWFFGCCDFFFKPNVEGANHTPESLLIDNCEYLVFGYPLQEEIAYQICPPPVEVFLKIKNVTDKQIYILDIGGNKLSFEAIYVKSSMNANLVFCEHGKGVKDNLLIKKDVSTRISITHHKLFLTLFRPYCVNDLLENSL